MSDKHEDKKHEQPAKAVESATSARAKAEQKNDADIAKAAAEQHEADIKAASAQAQAQVGKKIPAKESQKAGSGKGGLGS